MQRALRAEWLRERHRTGEKKKMLKWAVIFFVVAIVAAAMAFGGIAGASASIAVTLFWLFLAITVILFLVGLVSGRRTSL